MMQRGRKGKLQLAAIADKIEYLWLQHERAFDAELADLRQLYGDVAVRQALDLVRQRDTEAA